MGNEDRAVVVGISDYPELAELRGPENDAVAFYNWLTKKDGGNIPSENVDLIVTSDFRSEASSGNAYCAKPTTEQIHTAFDKIDDISRANMKNDKGVRVGRRLYLYFSGHGITPGTISEGYISQFENAALLMANAAQGRFGHHIAGRSWANMFFRKGQFDEVVLFMDCCREHFPNIPLNPITHEDTVAYNLPDLNKRLLYGFAAQWNSLAREREMSDGKVRGIFTQALLSGLEGAAADTVSGIVTSQTLCRYMHENMKHFFLPEELENPRISKEPVFSYCSESNELKFSTHATTPKFPVRIHFPSELQGRSAEIKSFRTGAVSSAASLMTISLVPPTFDFETERGFYQIIADNGRNIIFPVVGKITPDLIKETEHVRFG